MTTAEKERFLQDCEKLSAAEFDKLLQIMEEVKKGAKE